MAETLPPPGYVPDHIDEAQAEAMAMEAAMCCAEAGYPVTPYRSGPCNWAFPDVPADVLDRARWLVFRKWGMVDG